MILDLLIYGALLGGSMGILAVGFSLIFGVSRIFYMSYGAIYMIAGYALYTASVLFGLTPLFSLFIAIAISSVTSFIIIRFGVFRIRKQEMNVVIITFAYASVLEQVVRLSLPPYPRTLPSYILGSIGIYGVVVSIERIVSLAVSLVCIAALWLFVAKTKTGKAIRATSESEEMAQILGVRTDRLILLVVAIASALAALASFLLAPIYLIEPSMGWDALIESFAVVVLGGLGSVKGTIFAAFILSYAEVAAGAYLMTGTQRMISFITIMFILLVRPRGLFGEKD